MNDMKKEGILVTLEKLFTESTKGSANTAAITAPIAKSDTAWMIIQVELSTLSASSSLPSSFSSIRC